MKKIKLLLILMLAALINTPIYAAYELVWEDNFTTVNTTAWTYETGIGPNSDGWGNWESQYYTDRTDNVKAENGKLVITAKKENYSGYGYTSGRIKTLGKVSCKYGKIEALIQCPSGATGIWSAFWMMGANVATNPWPRCGEIDIMEQMCTSNPASWNTTLATYHWNGTGAYAAAPYDHASYGLPKNVGEQLGNAYRIYGVEWTPSSLIGYIADLNGNNRVNIVTMNIAAATDDSNGIYAFHKEQFLLLNIALGGSYTDYTIDPAFTSGTMNVDWIRIYQDKVAYPTSTLTNNSNLIVGPPDTQAPTTPTNLQAPSVTDTQVNLTWTASTDNVAVVGYKVYNGTTYIKTVTTTSANITGLTASTGYTFNVSAIDATGNESSKASVATTTLLGGPTSGYWVVFKDDVSGLSSYVDLRSNNVDIWGGLAPATASSTYEGANALSYTVNATVGVGSWFGAGAKNGGVTRDFMALKYYILHFAYNTTYTGPLSVKLGGLGGTAGEYAVSFTPVADGNWHTYEMNMSDFTSLGMILGETMDNLIFSIVSENVTQTGKSIMIDDVYYKPDPEPNFDVSTEKIAKDSKSVSIYPNPAKEIVNIQAEKEDVASIYNMLGQIVYQGNIEEGTNSISISELNPGMYVVKVSSDKFVLIKE